MYKYYKRVHIFILFAFKGAFLKNLILQSKSISNSVYNNSLYIHWHTYISHITARNYIDIMYVQTNKNLFLFRLFIDWVSLNDCKWTISFQCK